MFFFSESLRLSETILDNQISVYFELYKLYYFK